MTPLHQGDRLKKKGQLALVERTGPIGLGRYRGTKDTLERRRWVRPGGEAHGGCDDRELPILNVHGDEHPTATVVYLNAICNGRRGPRRKTLAEAARHSSVVASRNQNRQRVAPPGSTVPTAVAARGARRYTNHGGAPADGALNSAVIARRCHRRAPANLRPPTAPPSPQRSPGR
ncbi:hypothetical protein I552_6589 [Mycobacterium xenopi 3993]|nr:hypothetical protein I552_6589 [Mycobacterium xenopi 3993]